MYAHVRIFGEFSEAYLLHVASVFLQYLDGFHISVPLVLRAARPLEQVQC